MHSSIHWFISLFTQPFIGSFICLFVSFMHACIICMCACTVCIYIPSLWSTSSFRDSPGIKVESRHRSSRLLASRRWFDTGSVSVLFHDPCGEGFTAPIVGNAPSLWPTNITCHRFKNHTICRDQWLVNLNNMMNESSLIRASVIK